MPYIKPEDRTLYKVRTFKGPGELNYAFTELCVRYLGERGESYQTYNDIIGALEGAKLEMYRRRVGAYEDAAKDKNGDVY